MKGARILITTLLLIAHSTVCLSQEATVSGGSEDAGFAASGEVIQPYDRLDVRIKGEPQLSDVYTIDPSGNIQFPLVGTVQASGRKASDLAADLESMFSIYLRHPALTVERIPQNHVSALPATAGGTGTLGSYSVYIMGAVKNPGVYYLREPISALQLIVRSGGIDEIRTIGYLGRELGLNPDLSNVTIISESGAARRVDLANWQSGKIEPSGLSPGDTVIVPGHRAGTFAIYGEVSDQGVFEINQPILITEALALAGARLYSDYKNVHILRGDPKNPEAFCINLKAILAKKDIDLLPVIQPGDTIYVRRNLLARWYDFVEVIRGAERTTDNVDKIRDHWTGRDIDRD